jgi:hypothetical protein
MRTESTLLDNEGQPLDAGAERSGAVVRIANRIGARILHEAREALPPTIFFFVGFNFIVFTTNLLLADYAIAVSNFMLATVAALVVGKAVLVANAMPYLRRYDRAPLIRPILFKTAFYWVIVFLARLLERFVHFSVIERNPPSDFVPYLITTFSWHRFCAISVDPGPVPDLCDCDRIQPPVRPRRAAPAVPNLPSVRIAAQSAPAAPRVAEAEPACRCALGRRIPQFSQRRTPRVG